VEVWVVEVCWWWGRETAFPLTCSSCRSPGASGEFPVVSLTFPRVGQDFKREVQAYGHFLGIWATITVRVIPKHQPAVCSLDYL
jgi:hypothetical protein